jgi:hypothetical protein
MTVRDRLLQPRRGIRNGVGFRDADRVEALGARERLDQGPQRSRRQKSRLA